MTQTEEQPTPMEGVLSQRPEVQLGSLLAIKDDIIGHSLRKSLYIDQRLVPPLIDLLQNVSTPADIKVEATIVLGSLFHGNFPFRSFFFLFFLTFAE
jgi:hypothetical protein